MAILDVLTIGTHVSFDLWPAAVIGTTFNNAEVAAVLDFNTAKLFTDVGAMHANIFPTLPVGTINDPSKYLYIKFILENGNTEIIGVPWIKESSIITNSTQNLTVTILAVNPVDQSRVREVLAHAGFTVVNPILS